MRWIPSFRAGLYVCTLAALSAWATPAHAQRFCYFPACDPELIHCRQRLAQLEQQIQALNQSLAKCGHEKERLGGLLKKSESERDRFHAEVALLRGKLERTEDDLHKARTHVEKLTHEVQLVKVELAMANTRLEDLRVILSRCEKDRDVAQQHVHDLQTNLVALQKDLDAKTVESNRYATMFAAALVGDVFLLGCVAAVMYLCNRRNSGLIVEVQHVRTQYTQATVEIREATQRIKQLDVDFNNERLRATQLTAEIADKDRELHHAGDALRDARAQHDRDLQKLSDVNALAAGAQSQVAQLQRQLDDVRTQNIQLTAWLNEAKLARAFAEQRAAVSDEKALGTVREMAANKKECCPPAPAAIMGPTINTPAGPVTTPTGPVTTTTTPPAEMAGTTVSNPSTTPTNNSTPVGGTPGAAGGPSGPAAGAAAGPSATTAGAPGGASGGASGGGSGGASGGAAGGGAGGAAGAAAAGGAAGSGGGMPGGLGGLFGLSG